MHLSPKILGLNAGISDLFSGSSGQCVCYFFVLLLKKLITCWLCENHVNVCLRVY